MLALPLSVMIWLPLAGGLLGALLPRAAARIVACVTSLAVLGFAVTMIVDFPTHGGALHYVTNDNWISALGIRYHIGVDGLSLFLIVLTAVLWAVANFAAAAREWDRPRLFYFHLGLAESAVLGAFCAHDLALFVFFFDLMLIPFYFLIGTWGGRRRVEATTKFVIYTLVGSLLMLAGAIAIGVIATPPGGHISFDLTTLSTRHLPVSSQEWIFLLFALAFLVKMPAFPLQGWMPDAYRATPTPVLVLLSGVLSKVGAYGFLRIVLPLMPQASVHYQELMIVIAVVSILYGSALAFSQDDTRLVVGYSSVAQLGFITLGIFSLDSKGAQGAVLQMLNHGLVIAPLFLIIGYLCARVGGSDLLSRMGGIAFRAPVLAGLFLIVALATLAMPGSANFVGEFLILFGTFQHKLAFGVVASVGVVLAAVYMIRIYQRTMHNRLRAGAESRDVTRFEGALLAPLVVVILALGVYPQLVLGRARDATVSKVPIPTATARSAAVSDTPLPGGGGVTVK